MAAWIAFAAFIVMALAAVGGEGAGAVAPGQSRDEVIAALGKPVTEMRRGERTVAVFPGGVRVEFEDGMVVRTNRSDGNVITARDGTRYAAGEDGRLRRIDDAPVGEKPGHAIEKAAAPMAAVAQEPSSGSAASVEAPSAEAASVAGGQEAESAAADAEAPTGEAESSETVVNEIEALESVAAPAPDEAVKKMATLLEGGGVADEEPAAQGERSAKVLVAVVEFLARIVVTVVLLAMAFRWVGLPFLVRDLFKVALLSIAVSAGVSGLGSLGGHWQWLQLFRADEVIGFVVLAVALFRFKLVRTGITALRIAVATKVASYFLMIGIGVALSFGLGLGT